MDHEFVGHYLEGDTSGKEIKSLVLNSRNFLSEQSHFFTPGYLHKSLSNFNYWYRQKILDSKSASYLSEHKCLAIVMFLKNKDWWGEPCEKRSLNTVINTLKYCWENSWKNEAPNPNELLCNYPRIAIEGICDWRATIPSKVNLDKAILYLQKSKQDTFRL